MSCRAAESMHATYDRIGRLTHPARTDLPTDVRSYHYHFVTTTSTSTTILPPNLTTKKSELTTKSIMSDHLRNARQLPERAAF
eukprot:scaffold106402_cov30-Prasinocladus_malaysianus.AAC.2